MSIGNGRWQALGRRAVSGVVVLGSLTASYTGVTFWQHQRQLSAAAAREAREEAEDDPPVNPFAAHHGKHLIAFVITASDCGWSTQPATMEAVGSIRAKLQSAHGGAYAKVSVVGIGLDKDLGAGLRFLADLGQGKVDRAFDQVIVGGSWLNEQIVRFVWRERLADAASPQVILIERPVNTEAYLSASTIGVESDRLLANPSGSAEIVRWIDLGLPLDFTPMVPVPSVPQERPPQ
ncbi:MAG: hypothetical protein HOP28_02080 [Gemmatimonadales bacterium]|nr:hypothetical protein [Gemmatimonadales bacterium]